jgi:hypothetical protein
MQDKYEIFAEKGLSNIFDGVLVPQTQKQSNQVNHYKIIGYRLETNRAENIRITARQPEDVNGVYRATVFFDGIRRRVRNKNSALFPKHWSKEEVITAIFEAHQNKMVRDISDNQYEGKTQKGMDIILWLDENKKVTDAMPFRDVLTEGNTYKKAKRLCKICRQPKHLICLEHHQFKKTELEKFLENPLKRIKHYSRKIYLDVMRKLKFVE